MSQDIFEGKNERPEEHTVGARKKERDQLQAEIEAFLAKGGKIEKVDPHVTADPPQKPGNNYTSRPI
ncbi:hypothetical protein HBA55_07450 [Pseudomaricurvus alkylphenolicus]|jgi:hypothetical protein|uniref:hypothetical protein n=1 Tax=Pseudomaricurvus alkylphenolicus TaxID=1306991 RepID=UPI00141FBB9A|nr:hypothetical protein [Pseudomaricurvus alkylphenolicus]NIB39415.1 hypothetical protein [Pseudomaricurvus alkylphenolicus]